MNGIYKWSCNIPETVFKNHYAKLFNGGMSFDIDGISICRRNVTSYKAVCTSERINEKKIRPKKCKQYPDIFNSKKNCTDATYLLNAKDSLINKFSCLCRLLVTKFSVVFRWS